MVSIQDLKNKYKSRTKKENRSKLDDFKKIKRALIERYYFGDKDISEELDKKFKEEIDVANKTVTALCQLLGIPKNEE